MYISVKRGRLEVVVLQGADVGVIKPKNTISTLTASAMAIPVLAPCTVVHSAVAPNDHEVKIRYSQYQETDMPVERVTIGSIERYAIDVLQFSLQTPLKNNRVLNTYIAYETMTGASPLQSQQNAGGQTEVLMSGASIEEKRLDASLNVTRYAKRSTLGSTVSISQENDYQSLALSIDGSLENNTQHLTLLGSLSVSADRLSPTEPEKSPFRAQADGEEKNSLSVYLGFNRIINQYNTFQMGMGFTQLTGYLSDPYRIADFRPDLRQQNTFTFQYRTYNVMFKSALHFDYRYYIDNWDIKAHTIESSLWKNMSFSGFNLMLSPSVRYYWQHQASFFELDAASTEQYRSSDFRLSAYGSIKVGIDAIFRYKNTQVSMGVNQYFSAEDFALTGGQTYETPSLVNFTIVNFGIDQKF